MDMATIERHIVTMLNRLKKDKARILLLVRAFENEIKILKIHELTSTPPELAELYRDSIRRVVEVRRGLRELDRDFEKEFARIEEALRMLESNDIASIKTAFAQFVLSDVAFSKKTLTKTFLDYEELLKSVRNLTTRPSGAEDGEVGGAGDENEPISKADYEAVKQIAIRNGGKISTAEILSVIVRGYTKAGRIKDRLITEGVVLETENEEDV